MDYLRIILFIGLVFHKFLWELLKKRSGVAQKPQLSAGLLGRWFIKPIKLFVLLFIGFQTLFLDLFPIAEDPSNLRLWGTLIYCVGLGTAVLGRLQLGNNWKDLEDYQVLKNQSLTTNGIYQYVRHPIYTGDILLLIGLEVALNSWLVAFTAIPLVIIVRQAIAEEVLLSRVFPNYQHYCKRTKRFIPFVA